MTMFLMLSPFSSSSFSLLATTKDYVIFLCSVYASIQYTDIISINQELVGTI